jgi:Tol biopolymer transport system component
MKIAMLAACCAALVLSQAPAGAACSSALPLKTTAVPTLPGRIVFQGSDASGNNTQLYTFDFASAQQTQISVTAWTVATPINAVFSPNGKYIAFTAIRNSRRDDYIWQIGTSMPVNLTAAMTSATKSEDPKWSPDGQKLVIKQDANIKVLTLSFNASGVPSVASVAALTTNGVTGSATEASQPYYSADGKYVYLVRGAYPTTETVNVITLATGAETVFSVNNGTNYAYYPIVRDLTTVFYTGWTSSTAHADQILVMAPALLGATSYQQPAFNDCSWDNSDSASVDSDYLLFSSDSSTISSTHVYRPVIATLAGAHVWDLSRVGVGAGIAGGILGLSYTAAR